MKNQKLGYARVSTLDQNLDRQIDMLNQYGIDKLYTEKMSGTKRNRPELAKLLAHMDEGDTVVIESLSRLGRSTKDLIELVELFHSKRKTTNRLTNPIESARMKESLAESMGFS